MSTDTFSCLYFKIAGKSLNEFGVDADNEEYSSWVTKAGIVSTSVTAGILARKDGGGKRRPRLAGLDRAL